MTKVNLNGATAIVTGAGSGINLSFAKALHAKGCSVLIADIGLHRDAEAFLKSVQNDKAKVAFHRTDVTQWSQLEAVFDAFGKIFEGVPDIVCPGAGIYEPSHAGFWIDKDSPSSYKVLDINLVHPIKMTRIAIRRMLRAKKPGLILHISSIGAQYNSVITPLYQASKHGVSSFIRGMAPLQELCGIRVVGVAPGTVRTPLFFDTPQTAKWIDESKDFLLSPDEIAAGMIALCENETKYPAGTVLEVADVGEDRWRKVELLNDPGPQGPAKTVSNKDEGLERIKEFLAADAGKAKL